MVGCLVGWIQGCDKGWDVRKELGCSVGWLVSWTGRLADRWEYACKDGWFMEIIMMDLLTLEGWVDSNDGWNDWYFRGWHVCDNGVIVVGVVVFDNSYTPNSLMSIITIQKFL